MEVNGRVPLLGQRLLQPQEVKCAGSNPAVSIIQTGDGIMPLVMTGPNSPAPPYLEQCAIEIAKALIANGTNRDDVPEIAAGLAFDTFIKANERVKRHQQEQEAPRAASEVPIEGDGTAQAERGVVVE